MNARPYRLVLGLICLLAIVGGAGPAAADTTAQPLPFAQDWTNTGLITADDNWSGVPGVIGYRGDALVGSPGADPQTITADGAATPTDVTANQTSPNTFTTGGVAEFHITNPVVALQGSGTADAPHLVLSLDTTGDSAITVAYNLRDIDGSADNAVQRVALQYRVGSSASYTNLPAGFVADATTGPSLATQVTPVSVVLPAAADNQPLVQVRIITADAPGSDEWVGIDDISVTGSVIPGDDAPAVASSTPSPGATEVPASSNVAVEFTEPVVTSAAAFSVVCATSGTHTFAFSGGPTMYTLNPDSDFANGESCTVTVDDAGVSDVDSDDPPDTMAADHTFSFTTVGVFARIYQIQGAGHTSAFAGQLVSGVPGVITAVRPQSFYMQDATGDGVDATSDAVLVFVGGSTAGLAPGQAVLVSGRVTEFRPGGTSSTNLSTTEIINPVVTPAGPVTPIVPTVVGQGGRIPPTTVIEDDATGNVETSGVFDPSNDGIDFYESMEAMLLQVNDAVVVGPRNSFGEVWVLADDGEDAFLRTTRGGIIVRKLGLAPYPNDYAQGDFNPERIQLDDEIIFPAATTPNVNVGDHFGSSPVGVLDYNFGNFEVLLTSAPTRVDGGLAREVATAPKENELTVATFNVENLDPSDAPTIPRLAAIVVNNLRSPDLIGIEEMQDNTGSTNDGTTDATASWQAFIDAIVAAGGPKYEFRQINPQNNQDGGEPGGNIRVGFLFRPDRGLAFVDRPGGNATTPTGVFRQDGRAHLTLSPGRVDPLNPAWTATRKPLAGEFTWNDKTLIAIVNHFSSKGGDQPLFGRFQPPNRVSEVARHQQAASVNTFVKQILAAEKKANVIVLGDINDFDFSETTHILEGSELRSLVPLLPNAERYSYVFEGNSQVLDQILFSENALRGLIEFDVVHVNAEFHDQASDHDPSVARLKPLGGGGGGSK